jgi:hypothetical protein
VLLLLWLVCVGSIIDARAQIETEKQDGWNLNTRCPANSDKLYNRERILGKMIEILNTSVPDYTPKDPGFYITRFGEAGGFFVYDLTDISNFDIASEQLKCVNFINNHIYHFAPTQGHYSASHILILENGNLKVFKSINCRDSSDQLENVISYLEPKLKDDKNREEILVRLKNYRKYGSYITSDYPNYYCKDSVSPNRNNYSVDSETLFKGRNFLLEFSNLLNRSIPEYRKQFRNGFFADRYKAVGFFVYDLTDPRNKQTSHDEFVYFVKNHVYHFAPIDLPYSFSFIAVLGETDLKIFNAINCEGKGDSLNDVISYLEPKLNNDKNKDETLGRVKNYRQYGIYLPFDNKSKPQCQMFKTLGK